MSPSRPSRIDSLKIKAKLLQKAKKRAGKPFALKDAFELIATTSGFPSWREMKATLEAHELLRPVKASALWSVWYASYDEAAAHLAAHGGYLLPYQKQYFICDDDYVRAIGLDPASPDVLAVGRDWTKPKQAVSWQRLLGKLARAKLDPKSLVPSSLGAVRSIEPLTMGMSGASVYAVETDKGAFVLRVYHGDRGSWIKAIGMVRLASNAGVAPRLHYVDDKAQAIVSERISGLSIGAAIANPKTREAAVGSFISQLRTLQSQSTKGLTAVDAVAFARQIFSEQSKRSGFPDWALPITKRLAEIASVLESDKRQVVSHCDLNPNNVLWDGKRCWFVDWDNGGLAHPYLDLMSLTSFLSLPSEVTEVLAQHLLETPLDDVEKNRVSAMRDLVRIVYGCVFFRLVPDLKAVSIKSRTETMPLGEYFARIVKGELVLDSPQGQASVGAAFLAMI